ncbi:CoA transferase [Streptomyces sp. NBC_00568]|nr:CoA transferase [Streptomyces sp. NBC_00568]
MKGLRPGVAERLGDGPDDCGERNPGLVHARVTGWGRRVRSPGRPATT